MLRARVTGWRGLIGEWFQSRKSHRRTKRKLNKAIIEALEPRILLTTFQVTDNSDSATDPGSLRSVITSAESTHVNQTITFASSLAGQTITLGGNLLVNDPNCIL